MAFRAKYNLPPNDHRFLDLTDEEIVYDLILQAEYQKWVEDRFEEESGDDSKFIFKDSDEYDTVSKKMERGESVDLESLMSAEEDWEKVDG